MIIAMAGKGGVGKSTVAAQIIRELSEKDAVLAVDADPNSNLCDKLGMEAEGTIGGLRNEIVAHPDTVPAGISKQDYISMNVRQIMTESDRVDLLVMGRPEGEGCYCFTNDVLKNCFSELIPKYRYAVIDNEAGMEHFSRRTLPKADVIVFVSDPTKTGVKTAVRLSKLADEVRIEAGKKILVINNAPGALPDSLFAEAEDAGFSEVFVIPHDDCVSDAMMNGDVLDIPPDSAFAKSVSELVSLL